MSPVPDPRPILLLTRPAPQAERFAAQVEERCPGRFEMLIAPMMEIAPAAAAPSFDGVDALLFSSENAVRIFATRWARRDILAFCVGARTARVAQIAGFEAHSADGSAQNLADLVSRRLPTGARLLHPRGRHTTGGLLDALRAAGFDAADCVIYDQHPLPLSPAARDALAGRPPVLVPIFSPRAARLLAEDPGATGPHAATALCLSAAVADVLPQGLFSQVVTSDRPDAEAMLAAIAAWK
ncbi:uroporphyrinogen-III synthase [Maritimibacter sp. 55A14]|uniref:uroporphyrinogen-III synthase n=1 Tax=Maritimibacter sp. 55A14 TaxID=2174844 RepID=UPI0013050075|nr:uroporphyrinogen-III synthase [Maritimibacter sp. 55A14]